MLLLSQTSESRKKNKKDVLENGNFEGSPARKEQLSQLAFMRLHDNKLALNMVYRSMFARHWH